MDKGPQARGKRIFHVRNCEAVRACQLADVQLACIVGVSKIAKESNAPITFPHRLPLVDY